MAASGKEAVYGLINRDNGTEYNSSIVTLGTPEINTDPQQSTKNTRLVLTAVPTGGRVGTMPVFYNRESIRTAAGEDPVELSWEGEERIVDLLPKLNTLFRTQLVAEDVVDNLIPLGENGAVSFQLVMAAASYGWTGHFQLQLQTPAIPLDEEIETTDLNGLNVTDLQDPA